MKRAPRKYKRYLKCGLGIGDGLPLLKDTVVTQAIIKDDRGREDRDVLAWVPSRPQGEFGLRNRLRLAWDVFCGKSDALYWPGQEK